VWEIYAYQNVESLAGIFNAIVGVLGASTYAGALAAVAVCGFISAGIAYAFVPEKLQGWKWLATVLFVYSLLLVPRVTVGIVDKTGGTAVRVVANVPLGLAMFGGLTSAIGNGLTELFETAFQAIPGPGSLSAEFTYQRNGMLFGNRLIRDTRSVVIDNPYLRTDLINFVHNCTMYDLVDGTINPATFSTSGDVWALMGTPNPARFTSVTSAAGVISAVTCTQAYVDLSGRLPVAVNASISKLALKMNPTLPAAAATSAIAGQIQQAYIRNQIAGAAATAADLVRQNALINVINDSSQIIGQKINDPASQVLAVGRAQAVAQQNASWINGAKISEQALPILRNVIEALTYALFPLVVLLLLLTSGKDTMLALKSYVVILIWIQLWPPLYAVLNYMSTIYAQYDLAAAAEVGGGVKALALTTASTIYSNAVSAEAVVGYLVASIPVIAWTALKRMENFGTAVAGGVTALQGTTSAAASAAAIGNVGMGNVTMDQRVISPSTSNAWVERQQAVNGNWLTADGTGRMAVDMLRNQGVASRAVQVGVTQQMVDEASHAADTARSDLVSASTDRSAVLSDVLSRASARTSSFRQSSGESRAGFEEIGQSADRLSGISKQIADTTGVTQQQAQQIAFQLAAGTPGALPVSVGGSAGKSYSGTVVAAEQKVRSALTHDQEQEFKRFGDRVSRDSGFVRAVGNDSRDGSELASRLASTTSRAARAEQGYREATAIAERVSVAKQSGETLSIDIAQAPENSWLQHMYSGWVSRYGHDSQAIEALASSELARRALPPTAAFRDGVALPTTFRDVRATHEHASGDVQLNPDVLAARDNNNGLVRPAARGGTGAGSGLPADPSHPDLTGLRDEVRNRSADGPAGAPRRFDTFDARHEITRDADGTVGTKRSQAAGNARQLRDDVKNLGSNVVDAVRGKK